MIQAPAETPFATHSTFVTSLAWIFIVLSGLSTLMAVVQNAMLYTMGTFNEMPRSTVPGAEHAPAFFRFMLEHVHLFFLSFLIVSAVTLAAAVGLLRRKNWARLLFIGILALGITWNLGGIALEQVLFSSMGNVSPGTLPEHHAEFNQMASTMMVFTTVFAVGLALLFAWLIRRLTSRPIRAEFQQAL